LLEEVDALAGFLQRDLGIAAGDRVLLYMQNSPQFIIAYYAILRANGRDGLIDNRVVNPCPTANLEPGKKQSLPRRRQVSFT